MDLLNIPWINVLDQEGRVVQISPKEISNTKFIDIYEVRPDFKGAIYQFLIGLLQTCFQLEDFSEWEEGWDSPPSVETLSNIFSKYQKAFIFNNASGPAFMQDLELDSSENLPIANLLIESPGENTIQYNKDLFIKRAQFNYICSKCACKALLTLQLNAHSGGQGHRVGLRGGGPLTTIVLPNDLKAPLWQRLWLNVLTMQTLPKGFINTKLNAAADIFPWLAPTRTSETGKKSISPSMTHPLQMYWAMPRRIRINFSETTVGLCDLCGSKDNLVSSYKTKNYGADYKGFWQHPLTPYKIKDNEPPLSVKGKVGGVSYRDWVGLILGDEQGVDPAFVIKCFPLELQLSSGMQVWCFGYDMDKMKARCWYENTLPFFHVSPDKVSILREAIDDLLTINREAIKQLKIFIKQAWFKNIASKDGIDFYSIEQQFWRETEYSFYQDLTEILARIKNSSPIFIDIYSKALNKTLSLTRRMFDEWVIAHSVENLNMGQVFIARKELHHWLKYSKPIKILQQKIETYEDSVKQSEVV